MMKVEIGKTAGEMWKFLGKNGKTALSGIGKKMGLTPEMTTLSVGWLAREDKIKINKEGKGTVVALTDTEAKIYQQAQG
jgi:hypothetical protein